MKRKGPQKYSSETIQSAITKYEGGARLSAIARELGVTKTTVKYWLDNATKFLPDEPGKNPVAARIQNRLTREVWDIIFTSLKHMKRKLEEASVRDLVSVVSELFDRQAQFGVLSARNGVPEKVFEKSEEVRITVQKFLQKKSSVETTEPLKESLGGGPPEQNDEPAAVPEIGDVAAEETHDD